MRRRTIGTGAFFAVVFVLVLIFTFSGNNEVQLDEQPTTATHRITVMSMHHMTDTQVRTQVAEFYPEFAHLIDPSIEVIRINDDNLWTRLSRSMRELFGQ